MTTPSVKAFSVSTTATPSSSWPDAPDTFAGSVRIMHAGRLGGSFGACEKAR